MLSVRINCNDVRVITRRRPFCCGKNRSALAHVFVQVYSNDLKPVQSFRPVVCAPVINYKDCRSNTKSFFHNQAQCLAIIVRGNNYKDLEVLS